MKRPQYSHRAFSLTELLVGVVIVTSLIVLVLVSMSTLRRHADTAQCTTHLRQMGTAIHTYAAEHQNTVPGPMSGGVQVRASEWGMRRANLANLINYLAPYYGVNNLPSAALVEIEAFRCPAAVRQIRHLNPGVDMATTQHYIHLATWLAPGVTERGFGFKDSQKVHLEPLKLSQFRDISRSIALIDRDISLLSLFGEGYSNLPNTPRESVHGEFRNVLFFDGRVEAVANSRFRAEDNAIRLRD